MATMATAKAIKRAIDRLMSPNMKLGKRMPMFLKSMPKTTVATACRKNSTPPVTSNWLMGSAESTGRMMNQCMAAPSSATPPTPTMKARYRGQPIMVWVQ